MPDWGALLIVTVLIALIFNFTNGFHDTANAIATVVSTRVFTMMVAILIAAILNFVGASVSTQVAKTIGSGIVDPHAITNVTLIAALLGAIIWNLITWYAGLPSSSTHALVGGLIGATVITAVRSWQALSWTALGYKILLPLLASPFLGFLIAYLLMGLLTYLARNLTPARVNTLFRRLQALSASFMAFNHGQNDAQKTMGIIATAVAVRYHQSWDITNHHQWIIIISALTMAAGTAFGGRRIIRTMGMRVVKLHPIEGFAAETTASAIIYAASNFNGLPVSSTHCISGSIMGVGARHRLSAVRWGVAQNIVVAWVLTLPAAGLLSALFAVLLVLLHIS